MNQVHEAITAHTRKQHAHLERFLELDEARERAIEEAVSLCEKGLSFSVERINAITAQINAHAGQGISPLRKPVTEQMVRDYTARRNR
ncbi:YpbS family protein [Paenibacillus sp. P26]|nr:YpbS family protein [Paenibacillus sp. P26]UUZ94963.1 YpbS family protein [Paenibacillus sp. P25]